MGLDPNIEKSSKEEPKKKTTLTPLKIKMKKTGRGPGGSSPVAKRMASQRTPIKTPNVKQIVESQFTLLRPEILAKYQVLQSPNLKKFRLAVESRLWLIW